MWVKSLPADDIVYAAENPQKADQIAAALRTENVCHEAALFGAAISGSTKDFDGGS